MAANSFWYAPRDRGVLFVSCLDDRVADACTISVFLASAVRAPSPPAVPAAPPPPFPLPPSQDDVGVLFLYTGAACIVAGLNQYAVPSIRAFARESTLRVPRLFNGQVSTSESWHEIVIARVRYCQRLNLRALRLRRRCHCPQSHRLGCRRSFIRWSHASSSF